jgi:hypothetical protein
MHGIELTKEEYAETYTEYVLETYKANDSGKFGKAGEIAVKRLVNHGRGNCDKVSAKGKPDFQHHGLRYEVKSNCGELNADIERNAYVIYTMDNARDFARPWDWKVIPADEFVRMIDDLGLRRVKKSSNGQLKESIQSYKNSKRKTLNLAKALKDYPTVEEWFF